MVLHRALSQPQNYNTPSVSPASASPVRQTGSAPAERPSQRAQAATPSMQPLPAADANRRPATPSSQAAQDALPLSRRGDIVSNSDDFVLGDDVSDLESGLGDVPVPEPEDQPLQTRSSGAVRRVRSLDRGAADLPRGNRNQPSGDAIDIPSFLRKR